MNADMKKKNILDDPEGFKASLDRGYRYAQVMRWVFRKNTDDFSRMTDMSLSMRNALADKWAVAALSPLSESVSADGSTRKILFGTEDGKSVETVDMVYDKRRTLCVSTQAGCRMNCSFCATGAMGFSRNLKVSEIIGQIIFFDDVTNIVFMGMGEPLDNFENLKKALFFLNDSKHMSFGARRITVSTVGIPEGIYGLAAMKKQFGLSWSLHSTLDHVRSSIIPINRVYPLSDVTEAVQHYARTVNGDITLEYVLLKGVNMNRLEAARLIDISRRTGAKINFIPYNEHPAADFQRAERDETEEFIALFKNSGVFYSVRDSKGGDISAACGQLAGKSTAER